MYAHQLLSPSKSPGQIVNLDADKSHQFALNWMSVHDRKPYYLEKLVLQHPAIINHISEFMRLVLKLKQDGRQLGLKRIELKAEPQLVDQVYQHIQQSLALSAGSLILRVVRDGLALRLVRGWDASLYCLHAGMQVEVELLPQALQEQEKQWGAGSEPLHLTCQRTSMANIIEEDQEDEEKSSEISYLVVKRYEQLLKLIQNNNTQAYFKLLKTDDPSLLGECQNELYKKELLNIQNELGAKGWAAIHYAIFAGSLEIMNFLIEVGVDVNSPTMDDWLPIQLAIRQQNQQVLDLLLAQPLLNINICTAHGLALNMAVQSGDPAMVEKLLSKDVNFAARDHLGRTVYDMLGINADPEIRDLLNRGERRQSITGLFAQKRNLFHALVSSYRGEVLHVRTPPRKDKQYYLCLDPYSKSLRLFEQKLHYPSYPKQIIPLSLIKKFKSLSKSQKSWYMKGEMNYFQVVTNKDKYVYGCSFENTVQRWVDAFVECCHHCEKYPESIQSFQKNDTVIIDRIIEESTVKKTSSHGSKNELMLLFTNKFRDSSKSPKSMNHSPSTKKTKSSASNEAEKLSPSKAETPVPPTPITSYKQLKDTVDATNKTSLKFSDFKITKVLGQGSFGTVFLAVDMRNPEKKKKYGLKCFKKKKLVANKQIKYTIAELNILKQISHPFIVNLHFTFQTPNYVYLGLDYCPNKDLSFHLMNEVTFPEREARIYAAEILLALEYLHSKNIIYRDLKPENIMLDGQGHVRLVDFGLSKQGNDRDFVAKSFCGSPAYLSPEMLHKKGVGKESDFYCLGAVLYEMIVGEPPFFSEDIVTLYSNISCSKLTFPKTVSQEAKSLMCGLLERNPKNRLGYRGPAEIRAHQFFRQIDWAALEKKNIKAPIREQVEAESGEGQCPDNLTEIVHQDYDYSADNYRVNRFINFSFVREEPAQ